MRNVLLFTIAILMILAIAARAGDLKSHWADSKIYADGNLDDWQGMPFQSYKDDYATYAVRNDSKYLYVAIRFNDPMWLRTIRSKGLTIWVNNKGKKDKIIGFNYNGGPDREEMEKLMEKSGLKPPGRMAEMMGQRQNRAADSTPTMFAVLEKDWWYQPTPVAENGQNGPAVAFGTENGVFVYEFVIPMAKCGDKYYGADLALDHKIRIGFEWGGAEKDEMHRGGMHVGGMGEGPGGGMPGGGMGGPGGGMPGGPGGMDMGDFKKYMEKQEFWVKAELAT